MTEPNGKRIEVIPEADPNIIHLIIHRVILVSLLVILGFLAFVMVFTSVTGIKSDDSTARELRQLRTEMNNTRRIIDNANKISRGSIDFQVCAFLIEPDVQKTPEVLDECKDQADLSR